MAALERDAAVEPAVELGVVVAAGEAAVVEDEGVPVRAPPDDAEPGEVDVEAVWVDAV